MHLDQAFGDPGQLWDRADAGRVCSGAEPASESSARVSSGHSSEETPARLKAANKRSCPVVHQGKLCIQVSRDSKTSLISTALCTGCGFCAKKCPFNAIRMINLPKGIDKEIVHSYGANQFVLAIPRCGKVLGLVGANGTGKMTVLKLLSSVKPNLGKPLNPPDWKQTLAFFRGSELQNYLTRYVENKLKVVHKIQDVYALRVLLNDSVVTEVLSTNDERSALNEVCEALDLHPLLSRRVGDLSGGELQRLAIAITILQRAEVYIFDEPSSFLDIKQRLKAAALIRSLLRHDNYVIVVEHDLSMLDYISDQVCCLYGEPGAFEVVTAPFSSGEGINIFLDGYLPTENVRFRDESLTFNISEANDSEPGFTRFSYPGMSKSHDGFRLEVMPGSFRDSQIIVMLGENGSGKTTFVKMLARKLNPDENTSELPGFIVSYKPQSIAPNISSSVRKFLQRKITPALDNPVFQSDVVKPLGINSLMDQELSTLSGGELQRVCLCRCLGAEADLYLIDEPSVNLDSEQRILASKVIKRFIYHSKKTAFVVEHDILMATYLADMVVVFQGEASVRCVAGAPESPAAGINRFLGQLGVTFRRDPVNFRPRMNKPDSLRDREQKLAGTFYDESDRGGSHHRRSSARSRRTTSS